MTSSHPDEDLRGASFRGDQLASSNFSGADLRGADFSSATLSGADFSDARLGLRPLTGAAILVFGFACSLGAGVVTGLMVTAVRDRLYGDNWENQAGAGHMLIVIVVFAIVMFWKGADTALKALGVTIAILLPINLLMNMIWGEVEWHSGARAVGVVLVLTMAMLTGILGRVIGGSFGAWAIMLVAVVGGLAAGRAQGGFAALVISVSLVLISKRALKFDQRDQSIRRAAHWIVKRWGTRFDGADLTDADFTGTSAANCDVTGAILVGVRWEPGQVPLSIEPAQPAGSG